MSSHRKQPYQVSANVGVLIHEVARKRRKVVDAVLSPLGITRAQRWVMIYLSQIDDDGISQRELAEAMKIGQVAIGERVALLENAGLVERQAGLADKRQKRIKLTDAGYDVLHRSRCVSDGVHKSILEGISSEEQNIVENVLNRMLDNLGAVERRTRLEKE